MRLFRDVAIKTKLQRVVALTTVIALAMACSIIIAYQYVNYRRLVVQRTSALAEVIAANTAAALRFGDPGAALETLQAFVKNPEILSARIYTPDGQVFAEYVRPGVVSVPLPFGKLEDGHVFDGNQFVLRHRIKLENDVVGLVGLRTDMRVELRQLQHSIAIVLGCMALATVVALALATRLQRYILDPILHLAETAERVAKTRDYSLRATVQSRDEVGALTGTFNDMLQQIQQRDREVSEAYEQLAKTTGNLQSSEERFRQLAENISEVFWMTNVDKSQMIYISPAYESVWGRTCESLYRNPFTWVDAVHPDDRDRLLTALPLQSTGEYDVEFRILRSSGSERWIRDRAFPIRNSSGKVYRLAGIAEDITERKQAEATLRNVNEMLEQRVRERTAELRESEERLRLALEASKAGVWSWEAATQTGRWDEQFRVLYGYPPQGIITTEDWLGRIHPDDRERVAKAQLAIIERGGGTSWNVEFRIEHPTDGVRWLTELGRVERDATGWIARTAGISIDITERKVAEEQIRHMNEVLEQRVRDRTAELELVNAALRTQQKEQQTILDSVPSFIWYKDRHNRIVRINQSAAVAIDKTVAEAEGKPTEELYPDEAAKYYADDLEVIRSGQPKIGIVEPVTVASGQKRWVQTDKVPFRNERGEIIGIIVCATDISERIAAEDKVRQAEQRYRLLVERVPAVTYTCELGEAGRWHFVSPQIEPLLGFTPEEWMADPNRWYQQVLPDDRSLAMLQDEQASRTGQYDADYRMLTRDGRTIWVRDTGVLIKPVDGSPPQMQGILREITARKLAEAAMSESEERYRQLVEQAPDAIGVAIAGKIAFINSQGVTLLGATDPQQLVGRSFAGFVQPADQPLLLERVRAVLETHAPAPLAQYTLVRLDGTTAQVEATATYITYQGVPAVQAVIRDVTARQVAEAALRASEENYRRVVNTLQEGLCLSDVNGVRTFVNPRMAEMVGYPIDELVGHSVFTTLDEAGVERVKAQLARRRQGLSDEYEHELIHKDGRRLTVMVHAVPLLDDQGRYLGSLASMADITARKRAEQAAHESQERLQAIMDNSPAVIYLKAADGKYLLINCRFETLFHVTRAEVIGKTDYDLFPCAAADELRKNDRRVLGEKVPLQFEEAVPHDDGLHTYVSVKFPFLDVTGEPYAVCGISTDITERHQLQRQVLEVSDREQRRIGQDLHDGLCQLLTGTAFAAKALEERLAAAGLVEAKDTREIIELVKRANAQARDIARGLYPIELQAGGLVSALRELAYSFGQLYKVECRLQCEPEVSLPESAKAVHIYRIVQEAVTNALKHGQARQISIALAQDNGMLALSVSDNGRGLSESAAEHAGMGLNIMAYRARMIGGTLRVNRRSTGGAVVELVCPIGKGEVNS